MGQGTQRTDEKRQAQKNVQEKSCIARLVSSTVGLATTE